MAGTRSCWSQCTPSAFPLNLPQGSMLHLFSPGAGQQGGRAATCREHEHAHDCSSKPQILLMEGFSSHRTVLGEGRELPALILRRDVLYPRGVVQGDLCLGCSVPESCRQHGWGWRAQPWTPGVTPASNSPLFCTVPCGKDRFYSIFIL